MRMLNHDDIEISREVSRFMNHDILKPKRNVLILTLRDRCENVHRKSRDHRDVNCG